ncbi:MAG: CHAT domain-containing protein [Cyanobacteria bacterium J06600_6]
MTVTITVREQSQTDTGFNVDLVIDGKKYPATASDPFTSKQEKELEWYFESWLRFPTLENIKADRAKASVREYGEDLFQQVFADSDAYAKYKQLINDNSVEITIAIESITPEFHAIHWEALQDPKFPRPLAIESVLVRKSVEPVVIEAQVKPSPTINLLVVTARPNGANDVGYRTISRPLVEAIRNAKLPVKIDILRPGTYEALSRHLDDQGKGYYHIVHFDVHGALKSYKNFQEGAEHDRYLYEGRYGRGKVEAYEGLKAFLALEGKETGEYDLVEAEEMADLLTGKGIPVCILNACQSGKQLNQTEEEDNRETSLGSRLMNAGMQMV